MMSTITVPLSDDSMQQLRHLATEAKSTPEDLIRACVEEWLQRANPDFIAAADYVLRKNTELYRRLA